MNLSTIRACIVSHREVNSSVTFLSTSDFICNAVVAVISSPTTTTSHACRDRRGNGAVGPDVERGSLFSASSVNGILFKMGVVLLERLETKQNFDHSHVGPDIHCSTC